MAIGVRQRAVARECDSACDAGSLYEVYSERILAYCIHALGNRSEAEDAVQTTFLQAHRALERGVTPTHEFAWLHTIAKNVCRTQKRTAARRAAVTGVDLDALPAAEREGDQADVLLDLGDALASIPERQRRALLLREWHGLSSEEVASRLGMSAPATYALLTRARRSLAHALSAPRRTTLGLNFGPLLLKLKTLFGGVAAKVAVGTVVAAVAVGGGLAVERSSPERARPSNSDAPRAVSPSSTAVSTRASTSSEQAAAKPSARGAAPRTVGERPVARPTTRSDQPGTVDVPAGSPTASPTAPPETPREPPTAQALPSVDETLPKTIQDALPPVPLPEVEVDLDAGAVTDLLPADPVPTVDAGTVTDAVPPLPVPAPVPLP